MKEPTKQCTICQEEKPEKEFTKGNQRCKACMREVAKEHYQRNKKRIIKEKLAKRDKEKHAKYMKKWRAEQKSKKD